MEKMGKDEEALKSYDSAIGMEPTDPFLWSGKGLVLLRLRSNDLAKRAFDKALELNPSLESAVEGKKIADERDAPGRDRHLRHEGLGGGVPGRGGDHQGRCVPRVRDSVFPSGRGVRLP